MTIAQEKSESDGCDVLSLPEAKEFIEGRLPDAIHSIVASHLADCLVCQNRVARLIPDWEMNQLLGSFRQLEDEAEYESFRSRLRMPPVPEIPLEVGDTVGPFRLLKKLGKGGSSTVFECMDAKLLRRVAVKVLNSRFLDDSSLARLEREARSLARLDHPGIVKAHEIKLNHFPPYIVMELVAGGSAGNLISKSPLPPQLAARIMAGVARAVHHAHELGIVHRDIKPSNLLVVQEFDPNGPLPAEITLKVSDFGLARPMADEAHLTSTDAIIGTPSYMSPEQSRGSKEDVGPATDIYALGVVLYEFLIGRPPLEADHVMETLRLVNEVEPIAPRQIQPGLARDLDTICMKCLRKDPAERYATASDLADDLDRFLEGRPILARPISPFGRVYRWCKRNRPLAAALGGMLILLCFVLALGVNYNMLQKDMRKQAEARSLRDREAARIARYESDSYRNILFFGIAQLSKISPRIAGIRNEAEAISVSEQAYAANRRMIEMYLNRPNFNKEIAGELIDFQFRDALALRDVGFLDDSVAILERLLSRAHRSRPGDSDHLLMISVGNRSAAVLGRIKIDQQKKGEAFRIMIDAWKDFELDPQLSGLEHIHWLERFGLLTTLLKTMESQTPKPELSKIKAELEIVSERIERSPPALATNPPR